MDNPGQRAAYGGMVNDRQDVAIIGGGLNGPALALALGQAGLRVTVIDARAAEERAGAAFDGRAYALAIASVRLLGAVGVWPALAREAQPMRKVIAMDGRPGEAPSPLNLTFDSAEIEEGAVGQMVEDRHLYAAFLQAMRDHPNITHLPASEVADHRAEAAGAVALLADGGAVAARLIVAADGRASPSARRAGIGRTGHGYGQTALVAALSHTVPHEGMARQIFFPNGPLALLPLTGNRVSVVWSETDANAAAIARLDDGRFLEVLGDRIGGLLGGLTLAGPRFSYPLSLTLADRYVGARLALLGDAAHGVHPVAGQGLNLGLRDVAVLAEVLVAAHRRGEDIGAEGVLQRYQSWRRPDATRLALGMDGVNQLFSNDLPGLRLARDAGLSVVGQIGPLRRAFMRQAAGLTQDARLLTGKAL